MFTDTHCHITKEYYDNIDEIISNAHRAGITKMIVNGIDYQSNDEVLKLAEKHEGVYAAIGFHPENIADFDLEHLKQIEKNIKSIVAIGEIGLDYHYEPCDREAQKKMLRSQLELAQKYEKPVIIHSRDATADTIAVLKEYPTVTGVIHCFSGSLETAQTYIALGYKLGFGGVLTFKNSHLKEVLKKIPQNCILLETDSPYLSPEPKRRAHNEPANVIYIAEFAARELQIDLEELSRITEANVKAVFDI